MALLGLFVGWPWLALVPAALFLALHHFSQRRAALVAGVVWLLYAFYEYAMKRRWMCTGECNIRVDLLLLYPILLLISVVAGVTGILAITRRRRGTS